MVFTVQFVLWKATILSRREKINWLVETIQTTKAQMPYCKHSIFRFARVISYAYTQIKYTHFYYSSENILSDIVSLWLTVVFCRTTTTRTNNIFNSIYKRINWSLKLIKYPITFINLLFFFEFICIRYTGYSVWSHLHNVIQTAISVRI